MEMLERYQKKDEELFAEVQKLMNGNTDSYNKLYELSEKYIYKIIYDIVKNLHTTEDLMQETYIQIYNKINTLQDPKAFYVWAGKIATNKTLRYLQKNRHEVLATGSTEDEDDTDFIFDKASADNEAFIPESILMDQEKQRLIANILDGLSVEQKLSVQYFYYEEMSVREIAEAMNCSEGTVKSRLNYARKSIKNSVIDLEVNEGTKLYSLAALPLFWIVFREGVEKLVVAGISAGAASAQAVAGAVVSENAVAGSAANVAGQAVAAPVATNTAGTTAGTAVKSAVSISAKVTAAAGTVGTKIAVVVCIAVVAVTAGSSVVKNASVIKEQVSHKSNVVIDDNVYNEFSSVINNYEDMGVEGEEIAERLSGASEREKEMYTLLNEYFDLYAQLKGAYQEALTPEQYTGVEANLLNTTDQGIALEAVSVEQFLNFVSEYEEYEQVQKLYDMQITMLKDTNDTCRASIALLQNDLSKQILGQFSADDINGYVLQGYNPQTIIQLYLMNYNDGTYNDLVDPANNLGMLSNQVIADLQTYTDYASTDSTVVQLNTEYTQKAAAENPEYYQKLQDYYNYLLQK